MSKLSCSMVCKTQSHISLILSLFFILTFSGCGDDTNIAVGGDGPCTKEDILDQSTDNCLVLESNVDLKTDDIFAVFQDWPDALQVAITAQPVFPDTSEAFFMNLTRLKMVNTTVLTTGNGPVVMLPDSSNAYSWQLNIQYGEFKAGTTFHDGEIKPIGTGTITIHEFTKTRLRATINSTTLERGLGGDMLGIGGELIVTK